jgi:hypothetical protein
LLEELQAVDWSQWRTSQAEGTEQADEELSAEDTAGPPRIIARAIVLRDAAYRPLAAAAADEEVGSGQLETPQGLLEWALIEEEGQLRLTLGSQSSELEGQRVRITAGPIESEVRLEVIVPGQVGSQVTLSAEERSRLPAATDLLLEVLGD